MNAPLRKPPMTRDQFFAWAEAEGGRWEFDGFAPVAMTGGTLDHRRITQNVYIALRSRLRGSACEALVEAGVATVGDAVRYPDVVVTCTKGRGDARLVPAPLLVFEVLSPASGRVDRIDKLREYRAVETIRRYVILEHASIALTLFARADGTSDWTATPLSGEDVLPLPEIDAAIPLAEFYEAIDFAA